MTKLFRFTLLILCIFLPGCGTYYAVSIDSQIGTATPSGPNCLLVSGTEGVGENDPIFLELARLTAPALRANGYEPILTRDAAQSLIKLSSWQEEPRTFTDISYVTRSYPVEVGWGRHRHLDFVYVDEPVITTGTIHTANLLLEAYELDKGKETGRLLWRTALRSAGENADYRVRLFCMAQVLPQVLGTQSGGSQRYDVFLGNDGKITVEHLGMGTLQ